MSTFTGDKYQRFSQNKCKLCKRTSIIFCVILLLNMMFKVPTCCVPVIYVFLSARKADLKKGFQHIVVLVIREKGGSKKGFSAS
jgi:hypothetical protein